MDFVVGQPRSGTVFVTNLLNAGGEVESLHQNLQTLSCYQIVAKGFAYYEGRVSADEIRRLVKLYELRPKIRIDVSWLSTWILPVLLDVYPNARFVHLVRDPRQNIRGAYNEHDVYGSLFSTHDSREAFMRWCVGQKQPWLYVLMENMLSNLPRVARADWDKLSSFEKNCVFWTEGHRLILDTLAHRKGAYMRVRLEDLTSDPEAAWGVMEFLGVSTPSRERLKQVLTTKHNSKDEPVWTEIRRIKTEQKLDLLPHEFADWSADHKATLRRFCGEMAETLGYNIG